MSTNNIRYTPIENTVSSIEIAAHLDREHTGTERSITGFASLEEATESDISFCREGYEHVLSDSKAGAVITPVLSSEYNGTLIRSPMPQPDFVATIHDFFLERQLEPSVHPSAIISEDAEFGDDCVIDAGVTIESDVTIGNKCVLGPGVTIGENVTIGDRCIFGTGTSIGQPGFGYQLTADDRVMNKLHQGSVVIEDDVHFGVNCSVDRGTFHETRIGEGSKIHNLCNFAHNVDIGVRNRMSPCCHFAGSSKTGADVRMHPHAVVGSHVSVRDGAEVGANSTVLDDVDPGKLVVGSPATPVD
jgi:UDP-3-O-[3-hydroxymyristoyl] glucosamine N-acyltransferase